MVRHLTQGALFTEILRKSNCDDNKAGPLNSNFFVENSTKRNCFHALQ